MLSEDFFTSVCGPPVAANTAISRDIGIYHNTLTPSYTVKSSFKKSSCPAHCLVVTEDHIFAAQDQKAQVHVYSRTRGNQETFVSFPERIRCLALTGDDLVLGTEGGRLYLWETCTGRLISTPPCHIQAVTCLAVTPHYILSGSEDSNVVVWATAQLLEVGANTDSEPDLVWSHHRAAITSLDASRSGNPSTSFCISASKDKTCSIWNYRTGQLLRTILFPSYLSSLQLDPSGRAMAAVSSDGSLYLVELFGENALLGVKSKEMASIVVQVKEPLAVADPDLGPANCIAMNHDGTFMLTGHAKGAVMRWTLKGDGQPVELANLNTSVSNIVFRPLLPRSKTYRPLHVVKPNQTKTAHNFTSQLTDPLGEESRLQGLLREPGFSADMIRRAVLAMVDAVPSGDEKTSEEEANLSAYVKSHRETMKRGMHG